MFELIKKIIGSDNGKAQTTDQDALNAHLALTVLLLEAAYAVKKKKNILLPHL